MAGITRNDVEAVIETQVAEEIFQGVTKESKALSMFKRLPNMTSDKTKLRILDSLPIAYFVDESTNNGRKNITKQAWANKYINAAELAVIVPIKENLLNDADIDIWAEVKPRIVEAFAKKIDNAMFFGVDKPTDWRKGLVPSVIDAGAEVTESGDGLYSDINNVMTKVEESGYNVNAILGGVGLKGKFRMMTDTTGQPLQTTEIGSVRREFMDNGVWNKNTSTLIAGDFSQAVYAIRQDVTYKVLTEAVIQDPSDGSILYNLAQDDMVALRVVMRLGWEIPNPVNALNETETRFPFASLKPESSVSL
jgi:HK97 family phage major capsid protein